MQESFSPRAFSFRRQLAASGLLMALVLSAACTPDDGAPAAEAAREAPAVPPVPAALAEEAVPDPVAAYTSEPEMQQAGIPCTGCGVVEAISIVEQEGKGSGAGAVIGGLVGGLAGNSIGGGSGRKLATVAGVIGGAVAGNKLEKERNASQLYQVSVALDEGGSRQMLMESLDGLGVGDKVILDDSGIRLRRN